MVEYFKVTIQLFWGGVSMISNIYPFYPLIHEDVKSFWDGCGQQVLKFQKCSCCGHIRWPASYICSECHSTDYVLVESKGNGVIYSFVVFRKSFHPSLRKKIPYVVATVTLDEGPMILTNIVNCDIDNLECGQNVVVKWHELEEGISLPTFQPSEEVRSL